jgi:hypothetical protein
MCRNFQTKQKTKMVVLHNNILIMESRNKNHNNSRKDLVSFSTINRVENPLGSCPKKPPADHRCCCVWEEFDFKFVTFLRMQNNLQQKLAWLFEVTSPPPPPQPANQQPHSMTSLPFFLFLFPFVESADSLSFWIRTISSYFGSERLCLKL